ncbi:class I adenylate-forming enzyme family protein [Rhodoferax sp. UBA5149]|uniref:class I adenylate-forming enzyme family protein n=1 Tax=Rhodoferax sp. UBA5149 TaxID=1947379 RepID=UPI0025D369AA|nr:AMP-binding protein [Rhodoferax sp. UBA5149]
MTGITYDVGCLTRVHQLLDRWIESQSDALALRDANLSLTYGQLDQAATSTMLQLKSLGVRAGDRVLVVGENCVAQAVLVIALSRMDAWCILSNARLSDREIDVFIEHSRPRRVLYTHKVSDDAARHAQRHGAQSVTWSWFGEMQVGPLDSETWVEPVLSSATEQVAAIIYTSGTSGAPKGVMLTHANLMFTAMSAARMRGLSPKDGSYCVLPMAHVVGIASQFLGTMCGGASVLFEPRFTPAETARVLADEGITSFVGVPAMYARLLEWARSSGHVLKADRVRFIAAAGSPMTAPLKAEVEAAFGQTLHNGYGLTECAPTIAQTRMEAPRSDCAVGQPIDDVKVRIVDQTGNDVRLGDIGELWIRSPGLMKGYYLNPVATAEAINSEGWFNTGDMARSNPDGALNIVGRTKELIIRSGLNVYPVEVEQAINAHKDVVQSAVVGRTVGHNEEVIAFVEKREGSSLDAATLQQYLREQLAPYKVPAEVCFLSALPAAPTGKVLKNVLKKMAQDSTASPVAEH